MKTVSATCVGLIRELISVFVGAQGRLSQLETRCARWGETENPSSKWVGFGRTEVSARLDGLVVCALSIGHGPRERGFEGILTG